MSIEESLLLSLIPDIVPIEINSDVWILSSSASKQCREWGFFGNQGPVQLCLVLEESCKMWDECLKCNLILGSMFLWVMEDQPYIGLIRNPALHE